MRFLAVLLSLPLVCATVAAQSYVPKTITFTGAPALADSEFLAATGLVAGKPLTESDIKAANQRLVDTGLFTDVRYRFDGQTLSFATTPGQLLLPTHFVNCPWWTQAQLQTELATRVPLFHGKVAPGSGMQEKLGHALEAMLKTKDVTATVTSLPAADEMSGEIRAVDFHVDQPAIVIGPVSFPGATAEWSPVLAEMAAAQAGKDYSTGNTEEALSQATVHLYRAKGYAEVKIASVVPGTPVKSGDKVLVPLTLLAEPGGQYRLGSFTVEGSPLVDQATALKTALLNPGDLAEEAKIRRALQAVGAPYAHQGYLDAKITASPTFQRDQHLVDYAVHVTPGDPYLMGQVSIQQLDSPRQAQFLTYWKMKAGDPFDPTYASGFLKKNAANLHALDGYSASYKQVKHLDTRIVDLQITFKKD